MLANSFLPLVCIDRLIFLNVLFSCAFIYLIGSICLFGCLVYDCFLFQETEYNGTVDTSCYDYGWASFGTIIQSPYLTVSWNLLLDEGFENFLKMK